MSKQAYWYEVLCDKHGTQEADIKYKHKSVVVGRPKNKKDRKGGGCHLCAAEKRREQGS